MNPEYDEQVKQFAISLTDTILWCLSQLSVDDPKNSLRICKQDAISLSSQDSQVYSVKSEREHHLWRLKLKPTPLVTDLRGGRLLAFDPSGTLSDDAACQASKGYFDVDNVPPFDTWVYYVYEEPYIQRLANRFLSQWQPDSEYLIAWVPPQFLELADAGIRVIPEKCITWLDELKSPFANELQSRGWI